MKWVRYRFTTGAEDYRPLVFVASYPWWCSGETSTDRFVIVAFLPEGEPLSKYWDDAEEVTSDTRDEVTFTDRFAKPRWYVPLDGKASV